MAIPAVLVLGVALWILISAFKYWYYSKMKIVYEHKIDEKLLEEIRQPPKSVLDKLAKRRLHKYTLDNHFSGVGSDSPTTESKNQEVAPDADNLHKNSRPLNIFEEFDLLQEQKRGTKPRSQAKYDRSIFEDVLSKLHRELQNERNSASASKNGSVNPE